MAYTEKELAQHNLTVYDSLADDYERKAEWRLADHEDGVGRLTKHLSPASKVLNLACAVGLDAYWFQQQGHDVTGVDIAPRMVEHAEARVPDAEFRTGDFLTMDFEDESFDAAFAWAFIHLFPGEQADHVMRKLHRLLKVGGHVLLSTTKSTDPSEGWLAKGDYRGGESIERYRRHWTPDELGESLENNGFEITEYSERVFPDKHFMVFVAQALKSRPNTH